MLEEGELKVICHPCSTTNKRHAILTGPKTKALSNVKAHLTRDRHKHSAKDWTKQIDKKCHSETTLANHEMVEIEMAKVEKEYPGLYRQVYNKNSSAKSAKMSCHICNALLSLFPERGNVIQNARTHASVHGDMKGGNDCKRKQTSLDMFMTKTPKRRKTDNSS